MKIVKKIIAYIILSIIALIASYSVIYACFFWYDVTLNGYIDYIFSFYGGFLGVTLYAMGTSIFVFSVIYAIFWSCFILRKKLF